MPRTAPWACSRPASRSAWGWVTRSWASACAGRHYRLAFARGARRGRRAALCGCGAACRPRPDRRRGRPRGPARGRVLLGAGWPASLLAIARGQRLGLGRRSPVVVLAVVGVVLLGRMGAASSCGVPAPLVDLRLACAHGVLGVNLAASCSGCRVFGGVAVVILLVQRPADGRLRPRLLGVRQRAADDADGAWPPCSRHRWPGGSTRHTGLRFVLPAGALAVAAAFGFFALLTTAPGTSW